MTKQKFDIDVPAKKIEVEEVKHVEAKEPEKIYTNADILEAFDTVVTVIEKVKAQKVKEGKNVNRYIQVIKRINSRDFRRIFA